MVKGMCMRGLAFFFLIFSVWIEIGFAEIEAPVLEFPGASEQVNLAINNNATLQLKWSSVASATGYLLSVTGPTGFASFTNKFIATDGSGSFVSSTLTNLREGDYSWGVSAVNATMGGAMSTSTFSVLEVPGLQSPTNGEQIHLIDNNTDLQLRWSRVASATGYLLDVSGPPGFGSFNNAFVDQEDLNPFVTYPLSQVTAGVYVWSVTAVSPPLVRPSLSSTFTIVSGTVGGGDLLAPTLLFPPDLAFAQVSSVHITFQWAPVGGATDYLLQLPGAFPSAIPSGGATQYRFQLLPQGSRIYQWNVTAANDEEQGQVSKNRQFLLTRHKWAPTDILFQLASDWFTLNSVLNVHPDPPSPQGEPITNHFEAIELKPYQRAAKPKSTTGPNGPTPIRPLSGNQVPLADSNGDRLIDSVFEWSFPNSIGYEFQLFNEDETLIFTHLLPHPSGAQNPVTRIPVATGTGNFSWRVRALKDDGTEATPYSNLQPFTVFFTE